MFFLRCAFFLSIVYVSIFCGAGSLQRSHAFEAVVSHDTAGVADAVVLRATDWCAGRPAQCFRDAARLTALVQTAVIEPVSDADDMVPAAVEAPPAPMPIPDPRRRAAHAVLTDVR